ncbi:MAG: Short-chain dehydrogenase/reductase [Succiniclasticum sp.]|jgi:NAD(P)-dependent dehydrogenase (short-subunit alcohol dehydrogenase family)
MEYGCKDRVVVISGGTSGIGLAAARLFCRDGARVFLLGRSRERGMAALNELTPLVPARKPEEAPRLVYVHCDVARRGDCQFAAAVVHAYGGRADILVHSAGVYCEQNLQDATEKMYRTVMDINAGGTFFLTQALVPLMAEGGSIVTVASDAGLAGNRGCALYSASKGAVVAMTRSLALDLAPRIRVNCVCPGDVDTPLLERQLAGADYTKEDMAFSYPLERIATADEVAHVIAAVASPANSFMTGAVVPVDGGITAQG